MNNVLYSSQGCMASFQRLLFIAGRQTAFSGISELSGGHHRLSASWPTNHAVLSNFSSDSQAIQREVPVQTPYHKPHGGAYPQGYHSGKHACLHQRCLLILKLILQFWPLYFTWERFDYQATSNAFAGWTASIHAILSHGEVLSCKGASHLSLCPAVLCIRGGKAEGSLLEHSFCKGPQSLASTNLAYLLAVCGC